MSNGFEKSTGTLYLVATPIGNIEDITLRALRILKEVDLIAAEDTRHTIKLLNYYGINCHLTSYFEHNKKLKGEKLINQLKEGKNIALVTDAGMPGISDPGSDLVKLAYDNDINVTVVPGACAVITALVLSGLDKDAFVFMGFIPKKSKDRNTIIEKILHESRTTVLYESPHHLLQTLKDLYNVIGDRKIAVLRELTKKYEERNIFKLRDAIVYYENTDPKGEFVLVIEGIDTQELLQENINKWEEISYEEHLNIYLNEGMTKMDAIKKIAQYRGLNKREVYNYFIQKK